MPPLPLKRRIVFQAWDDAKNFPPFDRVAAAETVHEFPEDGWSLAQLDFTTGVLVDHVGDEKAPTCLRCFRLRAGDQRPHKLGAKRVPSQVPLEDDEAITDWMHVVIWPDKFVAYDSRRDAPSLTRLSNYFGEMADQQVRFFPLYDRSLIDELEGLDEIKAIDIKFALARAEQVSALSQKGMLGGLYKIGKDLNAATVSTRVSVGQSRKTFLKSGVQDEVTEWAGSADEFLDTLVITGVKDGQVVHIDLLNKRLDDEASISRSAALGNAPSPTNAYAAIKAARKRLEASKRLARAVRVK